MVIEEISREGVLKASRESLGLSAVAGDLVDDPMLVALLRRAAGILCPCAPSTIIASVLEGLQYLVEETNSTEERLADLAERLIISGDLLELNQVTTDDPSVRATWVFAAPPSFVERPDNSIFLLGIVPDEVTPLPASLAGRVIHEGLVRVLTPELSEDLRSVLRGLGWLELSKTAWLKAPKPESSTQMREAMLRRLSEQPASGTIADALILDPSRDAHYYSGRWVNPTDQSGHFVARRPQAHGAPLWGYAAVMHGAVTKFLDLPLKGTRWRGCDVGWHLQMAIDDGLGRSQTYRCRAAPGGPTWISFRPYRCGLSDALQFSVAQPRGKSVCSPTGYRSAKFRPRRDFFGTHCGWHAKIESETKHDANDPRDDKTIARFAARLHRSDLSHQCVASHRATKGAS